MKRLIAISGGCNIALAMMVALLSVLAFANGRPHAMFNLRIAEPFWGGILTGTLAITGVILILASRDLPRRASLVYWEGLARLVAAGLLLSLGEPLIGEGAWWLGAYDAIWAVVYLVRLPKAVNATHRDLLLDRRRP